MFTYVVQGGVFAICCCQRFCTYAYFSDDRGFLLCARVSTSLCLLRWLLELWKQLVFHEETFPILTSSDGEMVRSAIAVLFEPF